MSRPGNDDPGFAPRRHTTLRGGIDDGFDDEHGDLAQGSDVIDARLYGWLHEYRTGTRLRPATSEEFERAARAALDDGGSGVIVIGDLECTVIIDD